ncbi:MAG: MATE family efflux transporter [Christensenellales bacterium]|jgi:putative MATE family efflux protein
MASTIYRDMTRGNPARLILSFSLPLLAGGLFQQLYSMVDTLVVGRFVGVDALGALGATNSTGFLVLSLVLGLTNGVSIVISQVFGAKDALGLRRAVGGAVTVTGAAGLVVSVAGVALARPLMALLGTPAELMDMAALYLQITFGGSLCQVAYNTASAVLRAVGDSRTPLYFLILASLLNVGLDLLLVLALPWGVAGVAIATVIAQGVSAVGCAAYIAKRYPMLRFGPREMLPTRRELARVLRIGLPMGVQSAVLSAGMMVIQRVINGFGSAVVAGYAAAGKVDQIPSMVLSNLGVATATYMGQNAGARDEGRIRQGFARASWITYGCALALSALILLLRGPLVGLFVSSGETVVLGHAMDYLGVSASFYLFSGAIFLYNSTLRALGDVWPPMASTLIELAVKVGGAVLLGGWIGPMGVWFATPIGWILCLIPSVIRYHSGSWRALLDRF